MNKINNKKLLKSTISAAVLAALVGCNDSSTEAKTNPVETVKFTILHTNDNHGRFWENSDGEYGMAARKTLIDQLRQEVEANGGEALLLSGGDINTGVPESDLQDAVPDFIGMNHIQYDAMAVGNHEFDNPRDILQMQQQLAEFPMLSANIYLKGKDERLFDPYKIFEKNGLKIAVIGLTTEDTARIGNPDFISDLEFRDPAAEAAKVIAELEKTEQPDIILATTHMGHYEDGHNGSNAPGDVTLARSLEPGTLDVIIGGHSQNPVCMEPGTNNYIEFNPGENCTPDQQNGTYIMQAHEWGKYVGRADFEVTGGVVKLANYELIPVNLKVKDENGDKVFVGEELQKDQDLYTLLKYYQDKGDAALGDLIAHLNGKLEGERDTVRSEQTNLGRLIATAATEVVPGASFGIMNSGGVRASINTDNADNFEVTYRHVLEVQPFGNTVTRVEMSGQEVQDYLGVVATKQIDSGAYAQFSGLNMNVDCQAEQVTINTIGGVTFDPEANYVFTVPSYNAAGGDGYPAVNYVDTGFVDADVLKAYFETKGTINATDYNFQGEIVYENSNVTTGCQITP